MWFVPTPLAVVAGAASSHGNIAIAATRNLSSDEQFEALATGKVDAVVTAMDNVMDWNLRSGPKDFRIAAQLESTTPLTLVGQSGRDSLESLRGARILVDAPNNGFVVALRAMLAASGLNSDQYSLVPTGGVKERFDAMLRAEGNATLLGPPFDGMALQAGLVRIARVQDSYPHFPGQGLVVRAGMMDVLRPALAEWLSCLDAARQQLAGSAEAGRQALFAAGFPAGGVEAMMACMPHSLCPDPAGVRLLVQQRQDAGLPGADVEYESLVDLTALPA